MFDIERECIKQDGADKFNKGLDNFIKLLDEIMSNENENK